MKGKNVTITSKNQITLPAEYVMKLHLSRHRQLVVRQRGDELILKPVPDVEEHFQELWAKLPSVKGTRTDEELKTTTRDAWSQKQA